MASYPGLSDIVTGPPAEVYLTIQFWAASLTKLQRAKHINHLLGEIRDLLSTDKYISQRVTYHIKE